MKSGETALRKSTNELAISTIIQTTRVKNAKAAIEGLSPTSQYTGTAKRIATANKKGKKIMVLAIMYAPLEASFIKTRHSCRYIGSDC